MSERSDVIYLYDGSFAGFLCCVFESFAKKQLPADIVPQALYEPSLFCPHDVPTDPDRARRVQLGIGRKLGEEVWYLVHNGFDCCVEQRERLLLDFIRLGFARGPRVVSLLTEEPVAQLHRAVLFLKRESHMFLQFIRFSESEGGLTAVIEPKNRVLPTIAPHFCDRLCSEQFLIYDETHREALLHRPGSPPQVALVPVEQYIEPETDAREQQFRGLWRLYFETIAIRERNNPRCQDNFLPHRYRSHMTEFAPKTPETPPAVRALRGEGG